MPASLKRYSARDRADVPSRSAAHGEDFGIALLLARTDQLLAIVLAALVVCVAYITLG